MQYRNMDLHANSNIVERKKPFVSDRYSWGWLCRWYTPSDVATTATRRVSRTLPRGMSYR